MEAISPNNSVTRVVLTGSESTGKTVLARQLADHYAAEFAPEFVRDFASAVGRPIVFEDTTEIAHGQIALEDRHLACAMSGRGLLIQDTDLLSTAVYSVHYFGKCDAWVERAARARRPDLYLLLEIDVPWVADSVRDRGDRREEMQQLFREAVAASGAPSVVISGTWSQRMKVASAAIDDALRRNATR
jgi:NadR type nicotinamide-nucleotide adenylyltransferase